MSRASIKPGMTFQDGGQTYFCRKDFIKKSKSSKNWYRLLKLESLCPDCGTLFTQYVGETTRTLNRRCGHCKKPRIKPKPNTVFD